MQLIYYIYLPVVKTTCPVVRSDYRRKKCYILAMAATNTICSDNSAFQNLTCSNIDIIDGVTLENHVFLISQLPCCAQLALPYRAKITGRIKNDMTEDVLLAVTVTLRDNNGLALAEYNDVIAIDEKQKGEFEVKLIEYDDRAKTYSLTVKKTEQF